jgi:hypothetical protein
VAGLARAYYEQTTASLIGTVAQILDTCGLSGGLQTGHAVILFVARPTPARKPVVVHLLYDVTRRAVVERPTLPGVDAATWIYLSDEAAGRAVVQLFSTEVRDPVLGQLGKLASTIVPKFRGAAAPPAQTFPIFVSASPATALPFKRATIAETDFIDEGKTQADGSVAFANQPRTWLTVNAGAGVFSGTRTGDERAKIEGKTYVGDPLARGATFAGVTFHVPYDGSRPRASAAERLGVVVAAVLTPSFGIYAGPSLGWRGLALTAGWAVMWVNVPPPSKRIGDVADSHESLATGRTGRALIAVSYAFGG